MVVNGFDMRKTLTSFSYLLSGFACNIIKILHKLTRQIYLCARAKKSSVEPGTHVVEVLISPSWSLWAPNRLL